jgi:hypothetical protein
MTHQELVDRGAKWLKNKGLLTIQDPFRVAGVIEQPDVIGWHENKSILIEVKVSRADFFADKKKHFRKVASAGMGKLRYYLCPKGMVEPDEIPSGWGLLYAYPKMIKTIKKPEVFKEINHRGEKCMLRSALRRLEIRGYLPEIYDGYPPADFVKKNLPETICLNGINYQRVKEDD